LFEPDADIRSFFLSAYRNVQFRKMRQSGFFQRDAEIVFSFSVGLVF
jgi:hypothetical protein